MRVSSQRALVVVGFAVHVHEPVLAVAFAVRYVALAVDHLAVTAYLLVI
jgi:hypothetical protein